METSNAGRMRTLDSSINIYARNKGMTNWTQWRFRIRVSVATSAEMGRIAVSVARQLIRARLVFINPGTNKPESPKFFSAKSPKILPNLLFYVFTCLVSLSLSLSLSLCNLQKKIYIYI